MQQRETRIIEENRRKSRIKEETEKYRNKYIGTEREISAIQSEIEELQGQLKSFSFHKTELEIMNDHWEQSARVLEHHKQELEEKLYHAEETRILYKEELNEVYYSKESEVHRLKEQCGELVQEIEALKHKTTEKISPISIIVKFMSTQSGQSAVSIQGNSISVRTRRKPGRLSVHHNKTFNFDNIATEDSLFSYIKPSLDPSVTRKNSCVIVYGQTGSGKSQTIHSLVKETFKYLNSNLGIQSLRVSYVEIRNEKIRDLLENRNIVHRDEISYREMSEEWLDSALKVYEGSKNLNANSHAVFTIDIGKYIQFVELAGSERIVKSVRLEEALLINKSLSALQNVLIGIQEQKPSIVYSESELTQVLRFSMENSLVSYILNCSHLPDDSDETLNTLAHGLKLKSNLPMNSMSEEFTNQEVERTLFLLINERTMKQELLRKIDKIERDIESFCYALKTRDSKIKSIENKIQLAKKTYQKEIRSLKREINYYSEKFTDLTSVTRKIDEQRRRSQSPVILHPTSPPSTPLLRLNSQTQRPSKIPVLRHAASTS